MKQMKLGNSSLAVSRIGLGCMRLSEDTQTALATIHAALDQGINFFDHADIYGRGRRETTFSAIWEVLPGLRDKVIVQSKCGIRYPGDPHVLAPKRYDFSYEHIVFSVEQSLRRLRTDYLDVLLLHRPDALVEPEEVARAFDDLYRAGKVRAFGVSNHTTLQIQLLQRYVTQPLIANQVQLSVAHPQLVDNGIVFNRNEMGIMSRSEGTLAFCRLQGITLQAWSPLAGGLVSGKTASQPDERIAETTVRVAQLAEEKGVSKESIVIAWLLRHPAGIQPIIGTTNPQRIAASCQADTTELSREEWYWLFEAGRGGALP